MSVPGSHPALFWPGATVSKSVSLIFEGPYESQRKFILSREGALLWVILSYLQTEAAAEDTQVWLTFCSAPFCVTHFRRGHRQIRNFSSGVCVTCQRDQPSGRIRKVEVGLQSLPHTHTQFVDTAIWPLHTFPIHTRVCYVHTPDEDGAIETCRVSNCE